jgi:hypothetical protein
MTGKILTDFLLAGLSIAFLWHFAYIWYYGQLLVQEPSIIIRSLETVMLLAIFAFSISRLVVDLRR